MFQYFFMAQQPLVGLGLIIKASRSHSGTLYSVGLLWTNDQPDAETSTWQHTTLTIDIHATGEIRTRNPRKPAAANPRLRSESQAIGHFRMSQSKTHYQYHRK